MVLVDTSIWVSHLIKSNSDLKTLLLYGDVMCHPFIIGELVCGQIKNRSEIISLLQSLPMVVVVEQEELLALIENYHLMGLGLGFVDVHLLASAILMGVPLWTLDKRLKQVSALLSIDYSIL
jgi:predicted nucleic acid-binding protein